MFHNVVNKLSEPATVHGLMGNEIIIPVGSAHQNFMICG